MDIPTDAIASSQASIEIDASPAAVYEMVSAIERMGEWSPEAVGGVWLEGGSGNEGDWFEGHNESAERAWQRECQVARAQPGSDFTFVVGGVEANCTWWSYEMEGLDTARTRLTERWWVVNKTPGLAAATPEQYAARVAGTPAMLETTLAGIKKVAES